MFDTIEDRLGPVLVLVNNAGARHDRLVQGLSKQAWARIIDVNLHGAFHTIQRAIRPMSQKRFGRIINLSSISATRPQPAQAAYAASKAGVEALTRTVAQEVTRRGVTVNAIAPGLVDTDFIPESLKSADAMKGVAGQASRQARGGGRRRQLPRVRRGRVRLRYRHNDGWRFLRRSGNRRTVLATEGGDLNRRLGGGRWSHGTGCNTDTGSDFCADPGRAG